MGLVEIR